MRRTLTAITAAALALPFVARAQTRYDEPSYYEPPRTESKMKPSMGLMGEVGVDDYVNDIGGSVNTGVGYGARLDLSPQRNVGLELGYHGAVNNMSSNLSNDGRLITNQVGGNLRLNVVPATRDLPLGLRPFVFGGAFYHRIDTDNFTPGISDDVNAFALPVGGGVEANLGDRFLVGGRFTYNFLFNEVDKLGGRDGDMWSASLNLGTRLSR
jgi:hypothetical protein